MKITRENAFNTGGGEVSEMTTKRTLVGYKMAGVIEAYAKYAKVPLREAFHLFYTSNLYKKIRFGISDMHCRSDGYLAEELQMEIDRKKAKRPKKF